MYWKDEGYLLSKNNFDENSIIIEAFTSQSWKIYWNCLWRFFKKTKKNFQIGNKILLNWRSKNENKIGYFNIELLNLFLHYFLMIKKDLFAFCRNINFKNFITRKTN